MTAKLRHIAPVPDLKREAEFYERSSASPLREAPNAIALSDGVMNGRC